MDKIMLEFPLCCLSYDASSKIKLSMIIAYCIVERSKKFETDYTERLEKILSNAKPPADFDKYCQSHCQLIIAGKEMGIKFECIDDILSAHSEISKYIENYISKHGDDAYCRIGKNLCIETMKGQFSYRQFAVLCAIQSILGKTKKFKRITKDRIRYAMNGYKSKSIAQIEMKPEQEILSDRQLGITIEILYSKKFFSKFTYAKRQTIYSTRLEDQELYDAVAKSKLYLAEKKMHSRDHQETEIIKFKLKQIRSNRQLENGQLKIAQV